MIDDRAPQRDRERHSHYAALIDALPDIMFRFSREGRYLEYVGGADEALVVPPEVFVGKLLSEVLPDIAETVLGKIAATLETRQTVYFEYEAAVPQGSTNIHEFEARMVVSGDDEVLAIVRDVTEQNRTAVALREQQVENTRLELMSQVSLALSHNIRNAVDPILIYAYQHDPNDPASCERLKMAAREQGQRIAAIVSAIDQLAISGEMPTTDAWGDDSPEMLDLEPLIRRYLENLSPRPNR